MDENKYFGFTGFESSQPVGNNTESDSQPVYESEHRYTGEQYSTGASEVSEPPAQANNGNDQSSIHDTTQDAVSAGETTNEVNSFTPTANINFMPNYTSAVQNAQFVQNPPPSYVPPVVYSSAQQTSGSKKSRRKKNPVNIGTVIAATLASAIIASGATSMVFLYADALGGSTADNSVSSSTANQVTNINVESTAESLIEAIAEKVTPSVVGVRVTSSVTTGMFGGTQSQVGEGSGIIYTEDGYIITNYHVISEAVENSGTVEIFLSTDTENSISADVVGYDVSADLAVLKVNQTGLPAIEIGDSDSLKVGQTAVAIGNPGGLQFMGSTSAGVISGLNRTIQLESSGSMKLIQTDAAINPGNSGGALVNSQGQLIGINSAKLAATDYEGMGFAIPINSAIEICDRIIQKIGEPTSYLGLEISTYYDSSTLQRMGYPAGVVVYSVTEGSPASEAGLERSDIITKINDVSVTSYAMFNSEKNKYNPGDVITLTVYRQGRTIEVSVTLGTSNATE